MRYPFSFAAVILFAVSVTGPARAQMSDGAMRMESIEHQMRQLTGQVEQLQYRNQQLEQQLRRLQEDSDYRFQELGAKGGSPRAAQPPRPQPQAAPPQQFQQPVQPGRRSEAEPAENPTYANPAVAPGVAQPPPSRQGAANQRGDVYDPRLDPNAPGAPRTLGALPPGQPSAPPADIFAEEQVGIRGGREPGAPLDISTLAGNAANDSGLLSPPGPARNPNAAGTLAAAPPSQTPRDFYDLGYGYIQRKDFAAAEETFRDFLKRYPSDRLTSDAQYWLGESLFQRQRYRDAAEAFLQVSTKYETSAKAPDSLLRLGQSLAALRERDAACATLGEISRKYPRASLGVKQGVEREQKRVGC
jgi:tol-pal system protein YbgF